MAERQSAPRTRGNAFQNDMADALNRIAVLERRLGNVSGYSGGGGGGANVYVRTTFGALPASAAIGDIGIVDAGGGSWAHVYYWTGAAWERTAYPVSATPGNQITTTYPDGLYVAAGGGGGAVNFIGVDAVDRLVGPSSTAEAALNGVAIPAITSNQVVVMECFGDIYNNTGANQAFTWRVRFNTTQVHVSSPNNISTDPARRRWHARVVYMATSTTSGYLAVFQTMTAPSGTEWNPMGSNNNLIGGRELSGVFDTSPGFGLNLMGQWSASNANLEARGQSAYAYVLG